MNLRTGYDEQPEDEHFDDGYCAEPASQSDDDAWWLPNEADVSAPDAPFHYRPGEGPHSL